MCLGLNVFTIHDTDRNSLELELSYTAEEVTAPVPLLGAEGSPLDPDDIWLAVITACANQNSIWESCSDTEARSAEGVG